MESLIIAGSSIAATVMAIPYFGFVGYVYKFKVMNLAKYKYVKKKIYKGIHKSIEEQDIQGLRDYLRALDKFDEKYSRLKTATIKKKLGITDEILKDRKLFKMKYDSDYLVEQVMGIHSASDSEIQKREKDLLQREQILDNFNEHDSLRKRELYIKKKEKELKDKEEELNEIISNLNKL